MLSVISRLTSCAALLCRACGNLTACVAVRYLTLRTGCEKHGRKNPLPYSFLPTAVGTAPSPPRARRIPALRRRRIPPLRFSEKLPARQGRTCLRQFVCPGQPVQQKEPPVRGEPACGSSRAPVSRRRKGAARQGRTRLRQFVCPGHLVQRKEKHRRIASTVLKVCTFTQIAAAYRHPYAPAPAGPVPDDRAR